MTRLMQAIERLKVYSPETLAIVAEDIIRQGQAAAEAACTIKGQKAREQKEEQAQAMIYAGSLILAVRSAICKNEIKLY